MALTHPNRNQTWLIDVSADDDLSTAVEKTQDDIVGIIVGAGFDGTAIGFQVSMDGATYYPLTWEGTAVSITAAAGDAIGIPAARLTGWRFVKLTSDANEGADVTFTPIWRNFNT
jgi:hypothetical protein